MMEIVCERINELMKRYKTASDFARALNMSRQTVGFWLTGNRVPDAESIRTICLKMDVTSDWLLGLDRNRANSEPVADLRSAIHDINTKEIASHIEDGTLQNWCCVLRKYMTDKLNMIL